MQTPDVYINRLLNANQDHVATILKHGSATDKSSLMHQLETELADTDFNYLNTVFHDSLRVANDGTHAVIEPPSRQHIFNLLQERERSQTSGRNGHLEQLEKLGYEAIRLGRVAFLILAGGSGTRLGKQAPKGFFICDGMQQQKSLFQIHCEKLRRREELAAASCEDSSLPQIHLLVMTSVQNDMETQKFFQENDFFGLAKEQVHFFRQCSLPCFNEATGKLLMETSGLLHLAPSGNGAVYSALASLQDGEREKESLLQRMQRLGVEYIQIGNVDNMLAKVADPVFVGYSISERAHVVVKTVPKNSADEPVGVFASVNGEWGVVEYTEIKARANEVDDETGRLRFEQANISCYLCSLQFLRVASEHMQSHLQYHVARKKITTDKGPVMGIKLEAFIFDFFRFSKECDDPQVDGAGFRIMQVDRSEEFAPIKNADGAMSDTPKEATQLTQALHKRWLIAALRDATSGKGSAHLAEADAAIAVLQSESVSIEISPLVSSEGEGLARYLPYVVYQLVHESSKRVLIERNDNLSNI